MSNVRLRQRGRTRLLRRRLSGSVARAPQIAKPRADDRRTGKPRLRPSAPRARGLARRRRGADVDSRHRALTQSARDDRRHCRRGVRSRHAHFRRRTEDLLGIRAAGVRPPCARTRLRAAAGRKRRRPAPAPSAAALRSPRRPGARETGAPARRRVDSRSQGDRSGTRRHGIARRGVDRRCSAVRRDVARGARDRRSPRSAQSDDRAIFVGDPALARRGLALLLDPATDVREASTALGQARALSPPSREPYDFLVAHFDALAGRVDRDAPGTWPRYAAQLCSAIDRESVSAFWNARVGRYAGAERELAQTLESIDACTALRTREARSVNAFLAQYR